MGELFLFPEEECTWWNPRLKRLCEIDGFIIKARDRHEML